MYMQYACTHTREKKKIITKSSKKKSHKILSFLNKNILPNIKPYFKKSLSPENLMRMPIILILCGNLEDHEQDEFNYQYYGVM